MHKKNIKLFTPGPLNTSPLVKSAMNYDIGSRTIATTQLTQEINKGIINIAQCGTDYECVLLQGSGTYALEAIISSLISKNDSILVISNGIYGERIAEICSIHNINYHELKMDWLSSISIQRIRSFLLKNLQINHIAVVQYETTVGVLNDIYSLTTIAEEFKCKVLVDAMSSFGALPLNYTSKSLIAIAASANKCLHSVPGVSFVLVKRNELINKNFSRTLSLDLCKQWKEFEISGQWRFTPPTHVLSALREAIREHQNSGGQKAKYKKYTNLTNILIYSLSKLNIHPVVKTNYRAPIITTFRISDEYSIAAKTLMDKLYTMNLVIYSTKLPDIKTFRIGCIGEINETDIKNLTGCIKKILLLSHNINNTK